MDNNFWLYIILIPFVINIISTALYEFIKPRFTRWKAKTSMAVARSRVDEIKKQVDEVAKFKDDSELLIKVALREILRAFWSVFITGMGIAVYFLAQSVMTSLVSSNSISADLSQSILTALSLLAIGFFLGHFNKSLRRILHYYRLIRDVIDYDDFMKRKASEIGYFEQSIKKLSRTRRSHKG